MIFMEQEIPESDVLFLFQEAVHNPENNDLRSKIIDPIIEVLQTPSGRRKYIDLGSEFIEANTDMLAKEYPTKPVVFPRKYVDNVLEIFGFTTNDLRDTLKPMFRQYSESANFATILNTPSNVIHVIALMYSDMVANRQLRDSAKQQLGLTNYSIIFSKYFKANFVNERVMAYTYMELDRSWGLVKSENMVNWIGMTVETVYAHWRTVINVKMSIETVIKFLNGLRNSFNQNMKGLRNKYEENLDKDALIGEDIKGDEEYLNTKNYASIRDNLMKLIKKGDTLYYSKDKLYPAIAQRRNVKEEILYEYSVNTIDKKDISLIIDTILYVFLVKENNEVKDINTTKFISRITKFPTACDRAIQGRPLVLPLSKKYDIDQAVVRAHICLVATYILMRINDIT